MTTQKEMSMDIAQLFKNLSFKPKYHFFFGKSNAK